MAIYSAVPPPASGVDVEAWTVSALESLNVASDAQGTGVSLSIPLDGNHDAEAKTKKPTVTRRVSGSAKQHYLNSRPSSPRSKRAATFAFRLGSET